MAIYACSEEGVESLLDLVSDISVSRDLIVAETNTLSQTTDDFTETLGPHYTSLKGALDEIRQLIDQAAQPMQDVAEKLQGISRKYQEIIYDDPFGSFEDGSDISGDASGTGGSGGGAVSWIGDNNNSMCVPSDPNGSVAKELGKYGVQGIEYKNGEVDFTPVSQYNIPFGDEKELYKSIGSFPIGKLMTKDGVKTREKFNGIIRTEWQKIAKQRLLNNILSDPGFAADFQNKTGVNTSSISSVSALSKELRRVGLTMHETPDCSMIQLIPTSIHSVFKHSGGTSAMLDKLISGDVHTLYGE